MSVAYHCLQTANVFYLLLKQSFGPNGLSVLLEGSDGHVSSMRSCLQLLNSMHLSHPAGTLLVTAVKQHHSTTGDGCKKFLTLVTEMLRNIYDHYLSSSEKQRFLIEVSRALADSQSVCDERMNAVMLMANTGKNEVKGMCCSLQPADFKEINSICSKIINTCLSNGCTYSVKVKLREILMALIFPEDMEAKNFTYLKQACSYCCDRLDELTVFQSGTAINDSRVYPGFLIEGDFIVEPKEKLKCFRVLLLQSGLGMEVDGQEIMKLKSKLHLSQTMASFTNYTERVVKYTKRQNIRMILCGGHISLEAAQLLREHNIAAIQMVPEETLRIIAEYCGTIPLSNTLDLVRQDCQNSCVEAVCCDYIRHRRIIHLQCAAVPGCQSNNNLLQYMPCGILLCAPTIGHCKQLVTTLKRTLKVVTTWCQPVEYGSLVSVCGGGVWEIQLSKEIECFLRENNIVKNTPSWIVFNSLQKGLLAIPSLLLYQKPPSKVIHEVMTTQREILKGFDCTSNSLQVVHDPSQWPAWEPLWSQRLLVLSVCEFLSQLLRIDQVLSVCGTLKNRLWKIEEDIDTDNVVI